MKTTTSLLNNRGQGLIQALVAIGIMSIGATAMMSMIADQNKQARALSEKLAKIDLEKQLSSILLESATCTAFLASTSQTLNTTKLSEQKIEYIQIKASAATTAPTVVQVGEYVNAGSGRSMKVSNISLASFSASGVDDKYLAKLNIGFDPTSTTVPMKNITLSITVYTDPATAVGSKKIIGCSPSGSAGNCYTFDPYTHVGWKYDGVQLTGCPEGEYMSGFKSYHWKNGLQRITGITCCALPGNTPTTWTPTSDYSAYK